MFSDEDYRRCVRTANLVIRVHRDVVVLEPLRPQLREHFLVLFSSVWPDYRGRGCGGFGACRHRVLCGEIGSTAGIRKHVGRTSRGGNSILNAFGGLALSRLYRQFLRPGVRPLGPPPHEGLPLLFRHFVRPGLPPLL